MPYQSQRRLLFYFFQLLFISVLLNKSTSIYKKIDRCQFEAHNKKSEVNEEKVKEYPF